MEMDDRLNSALFGKTLAELQALAAELGLPKYRAAQVFEAMYCGRVELIEEMTVRPVALREQLVAGATPWAGRRLCRRRSPSMGRSAT